MFLDIPQALLSLAAQNTNPSKSTAPQNAAGFLARTASMHTDSTQALPPSVCLTIRTGRCPQSYMTSYFTGCICLLFRETRSNESNGINRFQSKSLFQFVLSVSFFLGSTWESKRLGLRQKWVTDNNGPEQPSTEAGSPSRQIDSLITSVHLEALTSKIPSSA